MELKEFEEMATAIGIPPFYLKELNKNDKSHLASDYKEVIEDAISWGGAILQLFLWSDTPEGDQFWCEISDIYDRHGNFQQHKFDLAVKLSPFNGGRHRATDGKVYQFNMEGGRQPYPLNFHYSVGNSGGKYHCTLTITGHFDRYGKTQKRLLHKSEEEGFNGGINKISVTFSVKKEPTEADILIRENRVFDDFSSGLVPKFGAPKDDRKPEHPMWKKYDF